MGSVSSPGIGRHTWLPPNNSSKTPRWIARGAKNLLSAAGIAFNPDRMPSLSSFPGRAEIGWSDRGPFGEVAGCLSAASRPESRLVGQGAAQCTWPGLGRWIRGSPRQVYTGQMAEIRALENHQDNLPRLNKLCPNLRSN